MTIRQLICLLCGAVTVCLQAHADADGKGHRAAVMTGVYDYITEEPLWGAEVSILAPDSTLVTTLSADRKHGGSGNKTYNIRAKDCKTGYILAITCPGYYPASITVPKIGGREDMIFITPRPMMVNPLAMKKLKEAKDSTRTLGEVTVVATKVKMVMSGDTIVYNADAFDLAEGSMLDALVKRLPGVELRSNGQIFVGGEKVESLLLNGENFFKGNPRIALDNLPAYAVSNVKVYDKEDYIGQYGPGQRKPKVMDVRLRRQYNQGLISNIEAGGGTSDRYIGRLFALLYRDKSRLSLIANTNNTNDTRKPGESDTWDPDWQSAGRAVNTMGGLEYGSKFASDKLSLTSSLLFGHEKTDLTTDVYSERYMEGATMFTRSCDGRRDKGLTIDFDNDLVVTTTGGNYFKAQPFFRFKRLRSRYATVSESSDMDSYTNLINSLSDLGASFARRINTGFTGYSNLKIPHTPDKMKIEYNLSYSHARQEELSHYDLTYSDDRGGGGDHRRPWVLQPASEFRTLWRLRYEIWGLNISKLSLGLAIGYDIGYNHSSADRDYYRLELGDSIMTATDPLSLSLPLPSAYAAESRLSPDINYSYISRLSELQQTIYPKLSFSFPSVGFFKKAGFNMEVTPRISYDRSRLNYDRFGNHYFSKRDKLHPAIDAQLTMWGIFVNYGYQQIMPDLHLMIGITDSTDPLFVRLGNPGLRPAIKHTLAMDKSFGKWSSASQVNLHAEYNKLDNAIGQAASYDLATGVTTYRPDNIDGNWDAAGRVQLTHRFGPARRFTLENTAAVRYLRSADFINSARSVAHNTILNDGLSLETSLVDDMTLGINGSVEWRHVTSSLAQFSTINAVDYDYGLTFTAAKLPWDMSLTTDLVMHSRRGYGDPSLNDNQLVWNARVAKSMLRGNMTIALDGFDILGRLSNVRLVLNAQGRTETRYNTLPRYAMLHIIYRLNIQPRKRQ